jgi:hypothetical protein
MMHRGATFVAIPAHPNWSGPYLSERALVLSVDEKGQIQALDRAACYSSRTMTRPNTGPTK